MGKTGIYKAIVLYSRKNVINPHMALVGTSGSGKTNMMLNLIMKFSSMDSMYVIIIDWSGEYAQIASMLGIKDYVYDSEHSSLSFYANLSKCKNSEKLKKASAILKEVISKFGLLGTNMLMIFIDEVWHFLKNGETSAQISTIFREGRKYGVGIAVATQMLGEVNNEIIYNAGCLFIFKLYGSENILSLKSSMLLTDQELSILTDLNQGSCFSIMMMRDGSVSKTMLKRVQKFSINFFTVVCDGMEYKLDKRQALGLADSVFGKGASTKLDFVIESNMRSVSLGKIAEVLFDLDADRAKTVYFLRKLGISDLDIAGAIKYAISKPGA